MSYGAVIRNAWGDGRDCSVSDEMCEFRSCLHVAEDKGSYTPGRGYTSYYKNPKLVCMRRHVHGCPFPLPEPDPEKARCCPSPSFAKPKKGARPLYQFCQICRTKHEGKRLQLARDLPQYPAIRCKHSDVRERLVGDGFTCRKCRLYWQERPEPYEAGMTQDEILKLEHEQFMERIERIRKAQEKGVD